MWDKQDTFTRWYQGIFGVILFFVSVFLGALALQQLLDHSILFILTNRRTFIGAFAIGGFYISFRCLWYAVTGEDNMNRDDF